VRPSCEGPVFTPFSDTTPKGSRKTSHSSSRDPSVSLESLDTPTPTPPSLTGEEGGTASEGGGGDFEEVSSFDVMHALIKAHHWLADNAAEPWITEDDKSIVATLLTALVREATRSGVIDWPVEDSIPSVRAAAKAAADSTRDQDAEMGDATVRLPHPTISRPTHASNRGHPRGARPLPVPPVRTPRRAVRPATLGPPPQIDQTSRPLGAGPPLFAQAASFLGGLGSHTSVDGLVRLAKAFPELPTARLQAMQSQQTPT